MFKNTVVSSDTTKSISFNSLFVFLAFIEFIIISLIRSAYMEEWDSFQCVFHWN